MRRKARAGERNVGARGDAAEVVRFGSRDGVIHLWVSGGMAPEMGLLFGSSVGCLFFRFCYLFWVWVII